MSKLFVDAIRRITELERRQTNLARIGTIAQADYARARVRVAIGPLLTAWLPWLTHRAGSDRTWHAPEIGEQVLVIAPSGELAQAVVIPALYQTAHPANAGTPDIARITFDDGAILEYNRATHHLSADIPGSAALKTKTDVTATIGGKLTAKVTGPVSIDTAAAADIIAAGPATLKAPTVKIDSPATTVTGALTVAGLLTYSAGMAGSGSTGGGGAAVINGDVIADGISLKNHTHGGVESGTKRTTAPA